MSRLSEIQEQLQDTSAALAQIEQAIAQSPNSYGLVINGRSIAKRFRELESEFQSLAADVAIDVCRYRLFHDLRRRPTVSAIADAMGDFQELFTTAYEALKHGPRKTKGTHPEVPKESSLGFGYSFAGSVGIVMTLENRQLSLFESTLDSAMRALIDLAQSQTEQQVLLNSTLLGSPTIKAMRQWVGDHLDNDLGLAVEWIHGKSVKGELSLQLADLRHLAGVLDSAAEPIHEEIVRTGLLVGTETSSSHRCHFICDDGEEISAPYSPDIISMTNPVKMPARYEATFERKAKKMIATDSEVDATYRLIGLKPLGS